MIEGRRTGVPLLRGGTRSISAASNSSRMDSSEVRPASPSAHDVGPEASQPPQQHVHCVVTLAHRHVKLRVSELDTVGSLVELSKVKLHDKYPYEEFAGSVVGVRSARLDIGKYGFSAPPCSLDCFSSIVVIPAQTCI
jgi:hypothetical protein